jgi:hypothetical protein
LQQGWSQNPCYRPDMKTVCNEIVQLVLLADMQMVALLSHQGFKTKEEDLIKQSNSFNSEFTCSTQQSSLSCSDSTDVSLHYFGIQ